jgi:hypothetical protein
MLVLSDCSLMYMCADVMVQVARVTAVSVGVVYGSMKLAYLKVWS